MTAVHITHIDQTTTGWRAFARVDTYDISFIVASQRDEDDAHVLSQAEAQLQQMVAAGDTFPVLEKNTRI